MSSGRFDRVYSRFSIIFTLLATYLATHPRSSYIMLKKLVGSQINEILGRRLAHQSSAIIFLHHYDPLGFFPETWAMVLEDLAVDRSMIVIISSSFIQSSILNRLQSAGIELFIHEGFGKCIGSYKLISEALGSLLQSKNKSTPPWLFLLNDSVLPISSSLSLKPLVDKITSQYSSGRAIVGLTDSFQENVYHLQSYFLGISPNLVSSDLWYQFWNLYQPTNIRNQLIAKGELALSDYLSLNGCAIEAIYGFKHLLSSCPGAFNDREKAFCLPLEIRYNFLNISIYYWRQLLSSGFPFVKKSVLFDKFRFFPSMQLAHLFVDVKSAARDEILINDILYLMKSRLVYHSNSGSVASYFLLPLKKLRTGCSLLRALVLLSLSFLHSRVLGWR